MKSARSCSAVSLRVSRWTKFTARPQSPRQQISPSSTVMYSSAVSAPDEPAASASEAVHSLVAISVAASPSELGASADSSALPLTARRKLTQPTKPSSQPEPLEPSSAERRAVKRGPSLVTHRPGLAH